MQTWVFLSGPRMGASTLLQNIKSGDQAIKLRRALGIEKNARICTSETVRQRYAEDVIGVLEGADYQLHEWAEADDPKIMAKANRLIALHLPLPEWTKQHAESPGRSCHAAHLTLSEIRWYYTKLANWEVGRTDLQRTVPLEHWDIKAQKFIQL